MKKSKKLQCHAKKVILLVSLVYANKTKNGEIL